MPGRKKNDVAAQQAQGSKLDTLKNFMSNNAETIATTAVFAGLSAWGLNTTTAEWISSRSAMIVGVAGTMAVAGNVAAKNSAKVAKAAYGYVPSYQATKDTIANAASKVYSYVPSFRKAAEDKKAAGKKAEDKKAAPAPETKRGRSKSPARNRKNG